MIPYEAFGGGGRGVTDKRTKTGPGGEDITATNFDVWGEVATDFFEYPSASRRKMSALSNILYQFCLADRISSSLAFGSLSSSTLAGASVVPAIVFPCHGKKKITLPSLVAGSNIPIVLGE